MSRVVNSGLGGTASVIDTVDSLNINPSLTGAPLIPDGKNNLTLPGLLYLTNKDGIVATPGGGQANAVLITTGIARVAVCATANDSVKLPAAIAGMKITVPNAGVASLNVFPNTGDQINALAANAAFAVPAGKLVTFYSAGAGIWHSLLSA